MRSPVANTTTLRGASVDFRVVGFNQLQSPIPNTRGTVDRKAIVQYPGTGAITIAGRGGFHIRSTGNGAKVAEGCDVKVDVDGGGEIHLTLPQGFRPEIRWAMPRDKVAATCTPLPEPPVRITPARAVELV